MDYESYVASLPMWATRKNKLPDIREFLKVLGNPAMDRKIIHVAGTNGKGSVCAYLTEALLDRGFHTGTFVSPHLVNVRERILLDGVPVSEERFSEEAEKVKAAADLMAEKGFAHPTYFEFLFYTAMEVFAGTKPDYVILETGLGGRLDATNAVLPVLTVITSISMDHMKYLGNTITEIAGEKAGIIKQNVPLCYDRNSAEAERVLLSRAEEKNAMACAVDAEKARADQAYAFLPAAYMRENAAVAEKAFELLGLQAGKKFVSSVKRTHWAGRMEEIRPDVFLDGAHNEDGIRAFSDAACDICRKRNKKCVLLLSAVSDKDFRAMCLQIGKHLKPERIYTAELSCGRAAEEKNLTKEIQKATGLSAAACGSVETAFRTALKDKAQDEILFCTGSLYLVGEIFSLNGENNDQLR
jgi:dihydrofolate synthase/folylpolyglutamate synthase